MVNSIIPVPRLNRIPLGGLDLTRASILYLGSPYLVFAWGWLRPWAAVLLSAAVLGGMASVWREPRSKGSQWDRRVLGWAVGLALIWTLGSGLGGFAFQNEDHRKHNGVLNDLVKHPWPVYFETEAGKENRTPAAQPLVYYTAFYLPAALVGKGLGWEAANLTLLAWGTVGVFLSLLWFGRLSGDPTGKSLFVFILFSGLDLVGWLAVVGGLPAFGSHLEWWAGFCQLSSHTTLLFWVPQHAVAGWIGTSLVLDERGGQAGGKNLAFALTLLGLWSPFVLLGLVPLTLALCTRTKLADLKSLSTVVAAPLVLLFVGLYLSANVASFPRGWIWTFADRSPSLPVLILFYMLEFGVIALLAARLHPKGLQSQRALLGAAIGVLVFFPLYRVGRYHDLGMRGTLPALFVLCLLVAKSLRETRGTYGWTREALILLLFTAALTPFEEIARALSEVHALPTPAPIAGTTGDQGDLAQQYVGDAGSLFFRVFARRH